MPVQETSKARNPSPSRTVLIVEDEAPVRETTKSLLELSGFKVFAADDGDTAIEIYYRESSTIDVVLLDYSMPRKSGGDTFRELLNINPLVKVIVTSGFNQHGPIKEMMEMGAVGALQKPYRLPQLLAEIKAALAMD